MSEFELITITFSFVLGLGVAQILGAPSAALRNRHSMALHWMPLGFAASIFLFHIQYWFVLFDYDANLISEWTWWTYGPFLGLAVLLFLSGGVVLPTPGSDAGDSLIHDFEQRGKLSLVFLAAYILAWVPANAWSEGTWFTSDVWLNLGLVGLLTVTYFASSRRLQSAATGLFLTAQGYGLLFVWATPTDLG